MLFIWTFAAVVFSLCFNFGYDRPDEIISDVRKMNWPVYDGQRPQVSNGEEAIDESYLVTCAKSTVKMLDEPKFFTGGFQASMFIFGNLAIAYFLGEPMRELLDELYFPAPEVVGYLASAMLVFVLAASAGLFYFKSKHRFTPYRPSRTNPIEECAFVLQHYKT